MAVLAFHGGAGDDPLLAEFLDIDADGELPVFHGFAQGAFTETP